MEEIFIYLNLSIFILLIFYTKNRVLADRREIIEDKTDMIIKPLNLEYIFVKST